MSFKVSICVPVYNVEKYIARCARSLLGQTMAHECEFIFVEDCSRDNSWNVLCDTLSEYPGLQAQIKAVRHQRNQGSAKTRNDAAQMAIGDFVLQVDSDDWLELDAVQKLYDAAVNSKADISCCEAFLEWGDARQHERFGSSSENNIDNYNDYDFGILFSSLWNKLVKRELLLRPDVLSMPGITQWDDLQEATKLRTLADKIVLVKEPLYHYELSNTTSVSSRLTKEKVLEQAESAKIVEDFFRKLGMNQIRRRAVEVLKIQAKSPFLLGNTCFDIDLWRRTLPEVNAIAYHQPRTNLLTRAGYWCAAHGWDFAADAIFALRRRMKRIK